MSSSATFAAEIQILRLLKNQPARNIRGRGPNLLLIDGIIMPALIDGIIMPAKFAAEVNNYLDSSLVIKFNSDIPRV